MLSWAVSGKVALWEWKRLEESRIGEEREKDCRKSGAWPVVVDDEQLVVGVEIEYEVVEVPQLQRMEEYVVVELKVVVEMLVVEW